MHDRSTYNIAELIAKARDRIEFSKAEIGFIVDEITSDGMNDAQVGAFAMAVLCKGLTAKNGVFLTSAMRDSGEILNWKVDGPIADKHSTGGVGDGVSLLLAPILAACGVYVPMISGRGLGHTGGTLDKLEAISGFSTELSPIEMQNQLSTIGCVMAGQGPNLVPADGRLYSIRDVTATVPSIDLITASILSKKLAAGLDNLVLDVKFGLGAFMKTPNDAKKLAIRLVEVANELGCPTRALITDMNTPLATTAGNAVEVHEILDILDGKIKDGKFIELTKSLCVEILQSSGIYQNESDAVKKIDQVLDNGLVAQKFEQMSHAQGGSGSIDEMRKSLPQAHIIKDVILDNDEQFYGFDAYKLGMIVVGLGGGRAKHDDLIDHSVGISSIAPEAKSGDVIATIHANNESDFEVARVKLYDAILKKPLEHQLILDRIE